MLDQGHRRWRDTRQHLAGDGDVIALTMPSTPTQEHTMPARYQLYVMHDAVLDTHASGDRQRMSPGECVERLNKQIRSRPRLREVVKISSAEKPARAVIDLDIIDRLEHADTACRELGAQTVIWIGPNLLMLLADDYDSIRNDLLNETDAPSPEITDGVA